LQAWTVSDRLVSFFPLPILCRSFEEMRCANVVIRGINEGRQSARDVDSYLTGMGTQLPVTGGIVKRPPFELMHKIEAAPEKLITVAA
jgi:glutamate synthase (NADPH/NADH)